jgi:hypothetical protein
MAGFFDTLLSLGQGLTQAHAQHLQALRQALQDSDMQRARNQLTAYLQALTDAGLLGFKASLAWAINSESNAQVRTGLEWVAAHTDGLRAGEFAAVTPQTLAQQALSLQQTATLVTPWLQLAPAQRQQQLHSSLQAMPRASRTVFADHLDTLVTQAQAHLQQLQQQQAANSSSAWGNSIEDRMAYMQAHLRSGTPSPAPAVDPQQLATLQALQALAQAARQWRPAKEPAAKAQAAKAQPEKTQTALPARAQTAPADATDSAAALLAQLHQQLPQHSAGMDPARQAALHGYLARVTQMQQAHEARPALGPNATRAEREADLQACMAHTSAMRQELQALAELQRNVRREDGSPTAGSAPASPDADPAPSPNRAAVLAPLLGTLIDNVAALRGAVHTANNATESTRLEQLHNALVAARVQVGTLASQAPTTTAANTQVLHFERDSLRHTVQALRLHHRRGHLMVARPIWPTGPAGTVRPNPGLVVLAGAAPDTRRDVHHVVTLACQDRLLQAAPPAAPGTDLALAQWQALQAASLVVLDLSSADPQVYYQLGQAYALGSELLLLAQRGTQLPFDVAQAVLRYDTAADLAAALPAALDAALYGVQTLGLSGLMHHGLKHCRALVAQALADVESEGINSDATAGHSTLLLQQLQASVTQPLGFAAALEQLLAQLGNSRLVLLHPRWPGRYPAASTSTSTSISTSTATTSSAPARRCFVVMPFSTQLARTQALYQQLHTALAAQGVHVVRGDAALGQDIVASIWDETARASHVLVDLTGYNPNVCLELGMADAMGRDTLLIGVAGTAEARFAAIDKRRIHSYGARAADTANTTSTTDVGTAASDQALVQLAAAFVQRAPTLL